MYHIKTIYKKILADIITPVSIYLKLRDKFPNSILLESSDYHGNEDIYSYICCQPVAGIKVEKNILSTYFPDGKTTEVAISKSTNVPLEISNFAASFQSPKLDLLFLLHRHRQMPAQYRD